MSCQNISLYFYRYEAVSIPGMTEPQYAFLGYMTVYKFYAYPANLRPRLSQVLILPPFQGKGHATELLQAFYRDFIHVPNVCDITGERHAMGTSFDFLSVDMLDM